MENFEIGTNSNNQDGFIESIRTLETDLATVTTIMKRIEDGSYGKCDTCGADVAVEQLSANPQRLYCESHSPSPTSLL